ncbi:MAG TPA: HAD family hydrolase [Vicinamibacterales bacterium]|nr:HAD family hydrolase [Vicinamibacterales bacterium]
MPLSPDLVRARAARVRLLLLDVDGVLTDGSIVLGTDGQELKAFFVRDGTAIVLARRAGIEVGLISGRSSDVTSRRAAELGISIVVQGEVDKGAAYDRIVEALDLTPEETAYMGDDVLDLPVLRRAGLAAAPSDAAAEVLTDVHWVSRSAGGRGAVRELVELLLDARGRWDEAAGTVGTH